MLTWLLFSSPHCTLSLSLIAFRVTVLIWFFIRSKLPFTDEIILFSLSMAPNDFFAKYDALIDDLMKEHHIPGLSIAVVDGESTKTKSYGFARLPDEKVTPSTLFNAASMTKAQIAACVSILVDDLPDIDWTLPVSHLLREDFVLPDSYYTEHVTLEDILSHRSGMPEYIDLCFLIQ